MWVCHNNNYRLLQYGRLQGQNSHTPALIPQLVYPYGSLVLLGYEMTRIGLQQLILLDLRLSVDVVTVDMVTVVKVTKHA